VSAATCRPGRRRSSATKSCHPCCLPSVGRAADRPAGGCRRSSTRACVFGRVRASNSSRALETCCHAPDWFRSGCRRCAGRRVLGSTGRRFSGPAFVRRQDKDRTLEPGAVLNLPTRRKRWDFRTTTPGSRASREGEPAALRSGPRAHRSYRMPTPAAGLARVEALGGEGLMLRQPGSPYEAGRRYVRQGQAISRTLKPAWSARAGKGATRPARGPARRIANAPLRRRHRPLGRRAASRRRSAARSRSATRN